MSEIITEELNQKINNLHNYIDGKRYNPDVKNMLHDLVDTFFLRFEIMDKTRFSFLILRNQTFRKQPEMLKRYYQALELPDDLKQLSQDFEEDFKEVKIECEFFNLLFYKHGGKYILKKNVDFHKRLCKNFFEKKGIKRNWSDEEVFSSNKEDDCTMINEIIEIESPNNTFKDGKW